MIEELHRYWVTGFDWPGTIDVGEALAAPDQQPGDREGLLSDPLEGGRNDVSCSAMGHG
jgi:hypothetical protein